MTLSEKCEWLLAMIENGCITSEECIKYIEEIGAPGNHPMCPRGDYTKEELDVMLWTVRKCDCGAEKCRTTHADWCSAR